MSERIDRRIGNGRLLVTVFVILALAAGAALFTMQRLGERPEAENRTPSSPPPIPRPDQPLLITLMVPDNGLLAPRTAAVQRQPDTEAQAREAISALFDDPGSGQSPVLKVLKLRALFVDGSRTGYVDLTQVRPEGLKASAGEELLGVYAIVNTLIQNFEEITRVRFLIEGRESDTLAGHIDLSRTFTKRTDLVKQ